MGNLKVYSASAGSGKTFTLAAHYIAIVLDNPNDFKHTLAVTFTNAATLEMKTRILEHLYDLSNEQEDTNFIEKVNEFASVKRNVSQMRELARRALTAIVHNYSQMNVSTIDSFFQRVIRALARELGLSGSMRLELSTESVVDSASNRLLDSSTRALSPVMQSLEKWMDERLEDGKGWDFRSDLKKAGKASLWNAMYLDHKEDIERLTMEDVEKLKGSLYSLKKQVEENAQRFADRYADRKADISNGNHKKWWDNWMGRLRQPASEKEDWEVKKSLVDYLSQAELEELDEEVLSKWKAYNSAKLTLKYLNELLMLKELDARVRELNTEENRYLLADAQPMLRQMIAGHDEAPFVYEKMGTWLKHIMIDEFQDTSTMQWDNFLVLLKDSLANYDARDLIVGDVKQSIYRWRDGDWQILNGLHAKTNLFGINAAQIKPDTLKSNFRSRKVVVDWNNELFCKMCKVVASALSGLVEPRNRSMLENAYGEANVEQMPLATNEGGYVEVTSMKGKVKKEVQAPCEWILDVLKRIEDKDGGKRTRTAILVRTNKQAREVASYLRKNGVSVASAEALLLESSGEVMKVVTAMRVLSQPKERLWQEELKSRMKGKSVQVEEKGSVLETLEYLTRVLCDDARKGDDLFLSTLMDQTRLWMSKTRVASVREWVMAWDDSIGKMSVNNKDAEGIEILTIHKSKGLERDNVIVPYVLDERNGNKKDVIWCHTDEKPYNTLPVVQVDFGDSMKDSIYEAEYKEELFNKVVDQMNTLYVAFTRAKSRLFVLTKSSDNALETGGLFGQTWHVMTDGVEDNALEAQWTERWMEANGEVCVKKWGSLEMPRNSHTSDAKQNPFKEKNLSHVFVPFSSSEFGNLRFLESNESRRMMGEEERELSQAMRGTLMHKAMEEIDTEADVDGLEEVFRQMAQEGLLREQDGEELGKQLKDLLKANFDKCPLTREWFREGLKLRKECSIVYKEDGALTTRRPDRVVEDESGRLIVIDYKFGERKKIYNKQVGTYVEQMKAMGKTQVEGWIWYLEEKAIEPIKG